MKRVVLTRSLLMAAALAFAACPSGNMTGTGGGSGSTGGGSATTGGGSGSTGGGTASTGGGTASTGGGTGSTGGGTGSTGGGTASTGGGTASTGGGTASTGGGTGSTGGGTGSTGGGSGSTGGGSGSTASPGAETCAAVATNIDAGVVVRGTTAGLISNYNPACGGGYFFDDLTFDVFLYSTPGADGVYRVTVPPNKRLNAKVTPDAPGSDGRQFDPQVYVVRAPAANCIAQTADGGSPLSMCLAGAQDYENPAAAETASWFNSSSSPVDVFVVVDSIFSGAETLSDGGTSGVPLAAGAFNLETSIEDPPSGDSCANAIALTSGTPLTNQTLSGFSNDYSTLPPLADGGSPSCFYFPVADRAYSITVNSGDVLDFEVAVDTSIRLFDPILNISETVAGCVDTCTRVVDTGFEGDGESFSWKNNSRNPVTLYVVVDSWQDLGRFTVNARTYTPVAGDACDTAATLSGTVTGTFTGTSNDYGSGTGCGASTGGVDRAYTFTLPNRQRASVSVVADGGVSVSLVAGAASACAASPLVCADAVNVTASSPGVARFTNGSGSQQTIYAIVDNSGAATVGTSFSLTLSASIPGDDDTCSSNVSQVTASSALFSLDGGFVSDYGRGASCSTSLGADRVFRVSADPNSRMVLTATPATDAGLDLVLNAFASVASCDGASRTCVASADQTFTNSAEALSYLNETGTAQDVYVSVAHYGPTLPANTAFTIVKTQAAIALGETCNNPQVITPGTLTNQTFTGFFSDYSLGNGSTCAFYAGPERVFAVDVAAGKTLTATVLAAGGGDTSVNIVDSASQCSAASPVCLDAADEVSTSEVVTYTNTGTATKRVLLVIGSYDDPPAGTFSLNVAIP